MLTKISDFKKLTPGNYCYYCHQPNPRKIIRPDEIIFECLSCGKTDGRILRIDPAIKTVEYNGTPEHFSVGSFLKNRKTGKFLFLKKRTYPQIIDFVAGHIRNEENPFEAIHREVKEESGLDLNHFQLLWEGLPTPLCCRYGVDNHYWYLFFNHYSGKPKRDLQEVGYFKEYTFAEIMAEPLFNPPIKAELLKMNLPLLAA